METFQPFTPHLLLMVTIDLASDPFFPFAVSYPTTSSMSYQRPDELLPDFFIYPVSIIIDFNSKAIFTTEI
jgi:hypothetical protein